MFHPFGPFGRNSPSHCFKWGFSQTVSGKISPKWGKHYQIEHTYGIFSGSISEKEKLTADYLKGRKALKL
jgi:hypothetical protein